ncbi:MAG: phosphoglycolate phosphatase [Zetaproteobacteria bacterium CG_4_9_14_3_um_filter_49_83]|nr:MAG: phosphoglycolate phosphatase [Zetaproteobacteria bacterium CG1_02_49_23]PIQ34324.1 MAG: phosphoglycolate phosphatase [Zetaproteobacteria bacterium CG17_big_fil_post_rev_8_21_14_2_50_50_13]PIV29770.1 MAG: phosphoglycolate phosphatase [Zetaproteobacteria bacterium CG02_land_8_20_14_3_00_50_9]PIY57235.1 MAG: phosphoglycolate phosphatase [Zetaproteobacteria bacterium CG_4_10_14_0_8_um_filter_49_80]PJA35446.1 MAG: phosphoglycolate phosphatase [Zetaproteobacteria bacterium CG_4_9_14_3_um_filt
MPWKAVLFDLDGTLLDGFAPITYALNKTLIEFGLEPMDEVAIQRHTGRGECSMISLFGDRREEAGKRFLEFHDEKLFDVTPMAEATEMLEMLHQQGLKLAIVTSKSQIRADQQLAHLGWTDYFGSIIGLTPQRRQKPDPHTIYLACEALQVSPEHALMIGDGIADMKAAVNASTTAVGVCHSFTSDELIEAGAMLAFADLPAIRQWMLKL